jgi:hypothetical protein
VKELSWSDQGESMRTAIFDMSINKEPSKPIVIEAQISGNISESEPMSKVLARVIMELSAKS